MEGNVKKIISQLINNLGISRNDRSFDEADSWYTVYTSGMRVIEVRLSNHRTDVNTWANRQYRSDVPSKRISIVFRDGNYNGQTLLNEPTSKHIIVEEYVYDLRDGSTMSDRQISTMTKAIRDIAINGQFSDPFQLAEYFEIQGKYIARNSLKDNQGNTVAATKWTIGADETNESKTMKYMKTNKRTITESQLRNIIAESVKRLLEDIDISKLPWANEPYEYVSNCTQMNADLVQKLSGWDEWADNEYHIKQDLLDNGTITILSKEQFDSMLKKTDIHTPTFLSYTYTYYAKNNRYDALFAYSEKSDVHFFFGH